MIEHKYIFNSLLNKFLAKIVKIWEKIQKITKKQLMKIEPGDLYFPEKIKYFSIINSSRLKNIHRL
jgi:hypothetical protein